MASPERRQALAFRKEDDLSDEKTVLAILKRSNVLSVDFDYDAFDALVDKASTEEMPGYDYHGLLRDFEALMTSLGVMPFNEAELPQEDPATF